MAARVRHLSHRSVRSCCCLVDAVVVRKTAQRGEPMVLLEVWLDFRTLRCMEWPYLTTDRWYPKIGRQHVHRIACEYLHGPPPASKPEAMHLCDNRICVNPLHLRWGTRKENATQSRLQGRHNFGENSPLAKLTNADVYEIRQRLADAEPQSRIARDFEIDNTLVWRIKNGKQWRHLTNDKDTK